MISLSLVPSLAWRWHGSKVFCVSRRWSGSMGVKSLPGVSNGLWQSVLQGFWQSFAVCFQTVVRQCGCVKFSNSRAVMVGDLHRSYVSRAVVTARRVCISAATGMQQLLGVKRLGNGCRCSFCNSGACTSIWRVCEEGCTLVFCMWLAVALSSSSTGLALCCCMPIVALLGWLKPSKRFHAVSAVSRLYIMSLAPICTHRCSCACYSTVLFVACAFYSYHILLR